MRMRVSVFKLVRSVKSQILQNGGTIDYDYHLIKSFLCVFQSCSLDVTNSPPFSRATMPEVYATSLADHPNVDNVEKDE
jgi:hypothetical protein